MTEDERNDLHEQAQDVVLLATTFTGLYRGLSNDEWDAFVAQTGKEIAELIVKRVNEKADELESVREAVAGER